MCYGTVSYGKQTAPVWDSVGGPDRDFIRLSEAQFSPQRRGDSTVKVHVGPVKLGLLTGRTVISSMGSIIQCADCGPYGLRMAGA